MYDSMRKKIPKTITEALSRMNRHINLEKDKRQERK